MSDLVHVSIDIGQQILSLIEHDRSLLSYTVSTAARGAGEHDGSYQTPRGEHRIRAKIGDQAPIGTVFKGRRPTGEIYSDTLAVESPRRDWILTRILWLCGSEPGINRFGNVDTMRRYIYIHGTPDYVPMGEPGSIGCIRMRNSDLMDLFDRVRVGTRVCLHE